MTTKNAATAHLLEGVNPGPGRWWKVELLKNVATQPIKVSLMESQVDGRVFDTGAWPPRPTGVRFAHLPFTADRLFAGGLTRAK